MAGARHPLDRVRRVTRRLAAETHYLRKMIESGTVRADPLARCSG